MSTARPRTRRESSPASPATTIAPAVGRSHQRVPSNRLPRHSVVQKVARPARIWIGIWMLGAGGGGAAGTFQPAGGTGGRFGTGGGSSPTPLWLALIPPPAATGTG